jgi:hypothetical protein
MVEILDGKKKPSDPALETFSIDMFHKEPEKLYARLKVLPDSLHSSRLIRTIFERGFDSTLH